jgi:hypothetical protein
MLRHHTGVTPQRIALVAAAALLVAACDGINFVGPQPWPEEFTLSGFWEGETPEGRFEMTLHHAVDGEVVTGSGAWIPRAGSRAFRVEGLVSEPAGVVSLLLELSPTTHGAGFAPVLIQYRARPWGHNELRGRLNGGGFDEAPLALRRTRATVRF